MKEGKGNIQVAGRQRTESNPTESESRADQWDRWMEAAVCVSIRCCWELGRRVGKEEKSVCQFCLSLSPKSKKKKLAGVPEDGETQLLKGRKECRQQ